MGWSGGSRVMEAVVAAVVAEVSQEDVRTRIYAPIVDQLRDMDWDCLDEVAEMDPALDAVLAQLYPEDFGDLAGRKQ